MEAPPINLTDAVVVLVILISGLLAFFRGLVHEVLAVISWIGAALATIYGFPYARPYATELITVPLIADADTGYGNPINAQRTLLGFENAGAACMMIEDQRTSPEDVGEAAGQKRGLVAQARSGDRTARNRMEVGEGPRRSRRQQPLR